MNKLSREECLDVIADMTQCTNFENHCVYRPGTNHAVLNKYTCEMTDQEFFHMRLKHSNANIREIG